MILNGEKNIYIKLKLEETTWIPKTEMNEQSTEGPKLANNKQC